MPAAPACASLRDERPQLNPDEIEGPVDTREEGAREERPDRLHSPDAELAQRLQGEEDPKSLWRLVRTIGAERGEERRGEMEDEERAH